MKIIWSVVAFSAGFCAGLLLNFPLKQPPSSPINVDYCFLSSNLEIFAGSQVITSAKIVVSVHGESLSDHACPLQGLPFASTVPNGSLLDAVNARLKIGAEVPVTFVARINTKSRFGSAFSYLKYRFGKTHPYTARIVITRIISIDKARVEEFSR